MNNRQKAKRFKKLYEATLPQKTFPVICAERQLQKYRCKIQIPKQITMLGEEHALDYAVENIARHFKEFIRDHVDYNTELGCYELTVWLRD